MSYPQLELIYFNIAGKAEAVRLACHYADIPLVDTRFNSRDDFIAMKESGKLPYGQVPVLIVNDKDVIAQSAAIMRYVGRLNPRLYPQDPLVAAKIDSLLDEEIDLFIGLGVARYKGKFNN